jgi:hypothetical protein
MKKYLLLGCGLAAAASTFAQISSANRRAVPVNIADKIATKFTSTESAPSSNSTTGPVLQPAAESSGNQRTSAVLPVSWSKFTGSMNIYGVTVSESKPLQYNDELNAVTFVHRKSATYVANPAPSVTGAQTGVLVSMVSTNLGQTWDSTCIWNDNVNWARYPQGGILNLSGNTSMASSTIVATAAITPNAGGWVGSAFAAKQLGSGTYNNVASSQTYVANSSPYTGLGVKVDFPAYDFTCTDDGAVRAIGGIFNGDINSTTVAGQDFVGGRILKGEFISGTGITWPETAITPSVRVGVDGNLLYNVPRMAWSEDGQIGYVIHIGSNAFPPNNSIENSGFQPIIYKTIDGGASWALVSGIDFTQPAFVTAVLNHVPSTSNDPNVTIPYFNVSEGMGAVVDRLGNLHIAALIAATFNSQPDSSAYFSSIPNAVDGENYNYMHIPGARPYLYDFTGDGTPNGWKVTIIDSLSSEGPGVTPVQPGFAANPWDQGGTNGTTKVDVSARVQLSRTPDGANIIYTWAETDTSLTVVGGVCQKWNKYPNVVARLMHVEQSGNMLLSPDEYIVTRIPGPNGNLNNNVSNRAYCHFASPKCALTSIVGTTVTVNLPITVSNSPAQLEQANPVNHWYSSAPLAFFVPFTVGLADKTANPFNSLIYPNPASTKAELSLDLKNKSNVTIEIVNIVGQTLRSSVSEGQAGTNTIDIDVKGLSKGIYMVNITADNTTSTKKLVIE